MLTRFYLQKSFGVTPQFYFDPPFCVVTYGVVAGGFKYPCVVWHSQSIQQWKRVDNSVIKTDQLVVIDESAQL